jgi:hypothetical protein
MANMNMPPGPGRPKGVPNKVTSELKAMILGALDEAGGKEYLVQQAKENPNAFMTLVGKYIPAEVNAKLTGNVKVNGTINFVRPGDKLPS